MARKKKNKNLPLRVYFHHGAYFYVDLDRKWHHLGRTLRDMYQAYALIVDEDAPTHTMDQLFNRYFAEVVPTKAPRTQKDNANELVYLRAFFGRMVPSDVRTQHGYQYYDERKRRSHTCAYREIQLLSHVFTQAVRWGIVEGNPIAYKVRKEKPAPRDRHVEDREYAAAYHVMPEMQQCAMDLALLTGLRPADLLGLTRADLADDGISITADKTGKAMIIEWTPALRATIKRALKLRPHIRQAIISKRNGKPYTVDGFRSIFYRYIKKAIADENNPLKEPFQFRDLRAKSASDDNLENAHKRLQHSDIKLTKSVYRRGVTRVRPLR